GSVGNVPRHFRAGLYLEQAARLPHVHAVAPVNGARLPRIHRQPCLHPERRAARPAAVDGFAAGVDELVVGRFWLGDGRRRGAIEDISSQPRACRAASRWPACAGTRHGCRDHDGNRRGDGDGTGHGTGNREPWPAQHPGPAGPLYPPAGRSAARQLRVADRGGDRRPGCGEPLRTRRRLRRAKVLDQFHFVHRFMPFCWCRGRCGSGALRVGFTPPSAERSFRRALASLDATVPTGTPRAIATSSWVSPLATRSSVSRYAPDRAPSAAASWPLTAWAATLSVTCSATDSAAGLTPVRAMARKNRISSRLRLLMRLVAMPYSHGRASACVLS